MGAEHRPRRSHAERENELKDNDRFIRSHAVENGYSPMLIVAAALRRSDKSREPSDHRACAEDLPVVSNGATLIETAHTLSVGGATGLL